MTSDLKIREALVSKTADKLATRIQNAASELRVAINEQSPPAAIRAVLVILHASEELSLLTEIRVTLSKGSA